MSDFLSVLVCQHVSLGLSLAELEMVAHPGQPGPVRKVPLLFAQQSPDLTHVLERVPGGFAEGPVLLVDPGRRPVGRLHFRRGAAHGSLPLSVFLSVRTRPWLAARAPADPAPPVREGEPSDPSM